MIQLRILRWVNFPGLSGLAQCNHKYSYKQEAGGSALIVGDVIMKERHWSNTRKAVEWAKKEMQVASRRNAALPIP